MREVRQKGLFKTFDKLVENYLRDGYFVASLFKAKDVIIVRLQHPNGNVITGRYDIDAEECVLN